MINQTGGIVDFRINRTLCAGSVRKPNLPGDKSVSLLFVTVVTDLGNSEDKRCQWIKRSNL